MGYHPAMNQTGSESVKIGIIGGSGLGQALGAGKPYDGVRLFLSVFPFIAMLGGAGVRWAWGALKVRGLPAWVAGWADFDLRS